MMNTVPTCDLEHRVRIKLGSLEGKVKRPDYEKLLEDPLLKFSGLCQSNSNYCAELRAEIELYSEGKSVALPVWSSYKPFSTRWKGDILCCSWNEWITLPLRFSDLPRQTVLCITVYDCSGPSQTVPIGGTSISLFGKKGVFRQGLMDLRVWPGQVADGSKISATPGKGPKNNRMYRLHKLRKKHMAGQIPKVDWLDRLSFSEIEAICEKEKRESDFMYLNVEFPVADYAGVQYGVSYYEKYMEDLDTTEDDRPTLGEPKWMPDHEILLDNLVENKHHALSRCARTGLSDVDLKPNAATRDQLNVVVNYPPIQTLSAYEQDLIWTYRYYLSSNKKALAKFLKCVKWDIAGERKQALELLARWAPMDVQDALELLGPQFSQAEVRLYAVARLKKAPDDDLLLYLLQLVQALKYEDHEQIRDALNHSLLIAPGDTDVEGGAVAIAKGLSKITRRESKSSKEPDPNKPSSQYPQPPEQSTSQVVTDGVSFSKQKTFDEQMLLDTANPDLASFLIYRACENSTLLNYFFWYLWIECDEHDVVLKPDKHIQEMYTNVLRRFLHCLKNGKPEWKLRRPILSRQRMFISKLVEVVKTVAKESANRQKKAERLQALLGEEGSLAKFNFAKFDPMPFPLDPEVMITGIVSKEATLFKSSQMPCKLTFNTATGDPYVAIFKHGDDLRQDQLVLQIITLMDKLLRKENLDLKLTPYRVLATSATHGFVQFIHSIPVAEVLATDGSIHSFFRKYNPSDTDMYNIEASVMDTYVKSCAGYCVITYLLGVGDRHLDNLLLMKGGNLFHIDFGYILGRDPKPMPPPMKLSKEMVDAMGGIMSEHYQEFKKLCYTAFLHLRRHANLILNLFSLMVGASVPDIALEPDKAVKKVLDKFRLELNDEAAVKYMHEIIDVSVSAFMPAIVEQFHKITQMLRK